MRLAQVEQLELAAQVLVQTGEILRRYGQHGFEGLALWAGTVHGPRARVEQVLVPEQNPIREESGVGYFVEAPILFNLSKHLEANKLRLLAQVHSHPTTAYHSDTDDRYAIVTENGGVSLVVPDFAVRPMRLEECAIYRLRGGRWDELRTDEVRTFFRVA